MTPAPIVSSSILTMVVVVLVKAGIVLWAVFRKRKPEPRGFEVTPANTGRQEVK